MDELSVLVRVTTLTVTDNATPTPEAALQESDESEIHREFSQDVPPVRIRVLKSVTPKPLPLIVRSCAPVEDTAGEIAARTS